MSSNNPTRRPRNIYDRIIDALEQGEKTFIQNLKVFGTDSSVSLGGLGGSSGSGGGNPGNGAFLPLAGGSMNGPIAYGPKPASTSVDLALRGHLNVSKDKGKFTSNIIINGSPSNWFLSYIDGDYWDGQILRIHVPVTEILILRDDGNLQLPPGQTSLQVAGAAYFEVMFNSTLSPNGNQGGWELVNPNTQINGCDIATKCYIQGLLGADGLFADFIIERMFESVLVSDGTDEYKTWGFIEPRTDSILGDGTKTLTESVNVGNGTQEYKTIGFISVPISESVSGVSEDAFTITDVNNGDGTDTVTFKNIVPAAGQFYSAALACKIDGSTVVSGSGSSVGVFTLSAVIASLAPGVHTAKISVAGYPDSTVLFSV